MLGNNHMRNVPYVDLVGQHEPLKKDVLAAVERLLDRGDFILGEDVVQFEERIAHYCGTRYAVSVNSGTDALFLVMKAYGIGDGDEVITAPNSFLASASTIVATGATPVFADVREDLNIDPVEVENKITTRTVAIMPVHLSGRPVDMNPIRELAETHGLKIIEDAAQSIGAEYRGVKTGALGDAGCFSLHPLKTLNGCGDGGIVTTDDTELRDTLVQFRNIGLKNRNEADLWGFNSRLDSIQAAILNVKFDQLESWTEKRIANAGRYCELLGKAVICPTTAEETRSVYHTFVIKAERRDELKKFLKHEGIGSSIHYPIPIHLQKASRRFGYRLGDFPVAERNAHQILSLPIRQDLSAEDIEYVAGTINEFTGDPQHA